MPGQKLSNQDPRTPSPAKPVTKKFPQHSRRRWLGLAFGLAGVAMISATAGALLAVSLSAKPLMQHELTPEEASVFSQGDLAKVNMRLPELTRPVNILVLGIKVVTADVDESLTKQYGYQALLNSFKGLSDTMLLLRFDPGTKKLTVLSIPRDTRTNVEGKGITKINAANYYGGPALSAKSTSELLGGVGIDRYVRINVQGVEKLIDALGGVSVYVPKDMKYQDDSQHLYINLKQGQHHLNGEQVLQFLRYRHDTLGDIGRIQRQQMLMRAFTDQVMNVGILARLPKILSVIQSHIDTNLSIEELVALVGFASEVQKSDVQMLMVPGDFSEPGEYDASYWLPDHSAIDTMMAQHFNVASDSLSPVEVTSHPTDLRISIQDSTDNSDAVNRLVEALSTAGYRNVTVSRPWSESLEATRIIAQNGNVEGAKAIQAALKLGNVVVESTGTLRSDITIQVGKDWLKAKASTRNPSR